MKLSNLRIETGNGKAKLVADVDSPFYQYKTLFYEVPEEYKSWLSDDVYDAFIIALIYPCMKHKDDIIVDGAISERLYRNLKNYAMKCIKDFSIELSMIDISASKLKVPEKRYHYVGAGFSGGVDSFSSIYDRFEKETDPKYKISALLCFNAGSHGDYDDSNTENKFYTRYKYLSSYPKEVGLPYIPENTNVHAYMDEGHQQSGITRHISCVLALQAAFDRYYYASSLSYFEEKYFGRDQFEFDLSEFCEPHFLAWISTESIELVSEGGQYFRSEKTKNIIDYSYAQKYLNVCVNHNMRDAKNCSCCEKCMRTLIAIDSVGALDKFSTVFDLDKWKKNKFTYLCRLRYLEGKEPFATDNAKFVRFNGKKVPCYLVAVIVYNYVRARRKLARILRKIFKR